LNRASAKIGARSMATLGRRLRLGRPTSSEIRAARFDAAATRSRSAPCQSPSTALL
jgi:hypothetical protein